HLVGEARDLLKVRAAVEWDDDMESLGSGRLDPAFAPELREEIPQDKTRRAERVRVFFERIEIEDADIRVEEVGYARRPDVRRDAVLVRKPSQATGIVDDGMLHDATFLRNGRALEPLGTLLQVFLEEPLFADPAVIPLHRDRASAKVGKHDRRDGLVVLGELALGDALIR